MNGYYWLPTCIGFRALTAAAHKLKPVEIKLFYKFCLRLKRKLRKFQITKKIAILKIQE